MIGLGDTSNSAAQHSGKPPWANSYDALRPWRPLGPSGEFRKFHGGRDWGGGAIPTQGFSIFGVGMWERSHLLHPSRKIKCGVVGKDAIMCDHPLMGANNKP